jgi:hypothetical protein
MSRPGLWNVVRFGTPLVYVPPATLNAKIEISVDAYARPFCFNLNKASKLLFFRTIPCALLSLLLHDRKIQYQSAFSSRGFKKAAGLVV